VRSLIRNIAQDLAGVGRKEAKDLGKRVCRSTALAAVVSVAVLDQMSA
jgi:hypothetical protein